jgi:hypothetical protein
MSRSSFFTFIIGSNNSNRNHMEHKSFKFHMIISFLLNNFEI